MANENNLEKEIKKNHNDNNTGILCGALVQYIISEPTSASFFIWLGVLDSYLFKSREDKKNGFKTPQDEMALYAFKNSTKFLTGATLVSGLRYFF